MSKAKRSHSKQENIRIENKVLKMKMMLEYGAEFQEMCIVPPEIENEWLHSISAFEAQHARGAKTTIFDKLGRPQCFKPVNEIPDNKIIEEWIRLHDYMNDYGVELSVCSPNISARELYRFTTEELFKCETDDISIPGMRTCFIYDEFYPDHEYDNQRIAVEECIRYFFERGDCADYYFQKNIRFNERVNLSRDVLVEIAGAFKAVSGEPAKVHIESGTCRITGEHCVVTGFYKVIFLKVDMLEGRRGNWLVESHFSKEFGCWQIFNIQVEGIGS